MTERLQQPHDSGRRTGRRRTPRARAVGVWGARTIPALPPMEVLPPPDIGEPAVLGSPPEAPAPTDDERVAPVPPSPELVALRRPDAVGCAALILAGVAANVSLSLSWSPGEGPTGLSLVQRGVEALGSGVAESVRSGLWQAPAVVLSGGLLVLLGMLLLVPARTHRLVGLLALLVSLGAAVAVGFLLADLDWTVDRFGPGTWFAVAVPVLGVLGSLKAMLTAPLVTLAPVEER